ncbi:DMT family transporter [Nonomuraea rhizosphaerae]|uniref:DMT family transporter n=1 Tax=Nonomuraea rhizosphaerae TaxID=2665663 RepID=UPI002484AFC1|nr:DMT family transporter [Nonomuraea rhizosphaerae]
MAVVPAPRPLLGAVLLLFVSAAWGSAFPLMKDLILRLPVEDLLTERYTIAALTLFLIRPRSLFRVSRATLLNGVILGIMFGVGQCAQAIALDSLPSSVSGFAVGCNVIITPVLALVMFKARVPRRVWAGVAMAMAGMTVLTLMRGIGETKISVLALGVTISAAALYSGHTLMLAKLSRAAKPFDAYALTVIQLATIGAMTGVMAVRDGITLPQTMPDWGILAHLSVVSCALGFLARSYGQAHVPAIPSAVLMSSQPLWVTLIAVIWFDEQVGTSMIVGGGLMAAAMLLAVPGRASPDEAAERAVVAATRQARRALADLKAKRDDPLKFDRLVASYPSKTACSHPQGCPWNGQARKRSVEPSFDRLIERATTIVRAKNGAGPGADPGAGRAIAPGGRCLCAMVEESGKIGTVSISRWFRSQ